MNSVFSLAGERLLEYFRGELVPGALSSPDMLRLAYPGMDGEFRLGLCLHELEEIHPHGPPGMTRLSEDSRRFPALLLALRFLAFANRKRVPILGGAAAPPDGRCGSQRGEEGVAHHLVGLRPTWLRVCPPFLSPAH